MSVVVVTIKVLTDDVTYEVGLAAKPSVGDLIDHAVPGGRRTVKVVGVKHVSGLMLTPYTIVLCSPVTEKGNDGVTNIVRRRRRCGPR